MMADIPKVKRNIERMLAAGAPEADIDAYLATEGVTAETLRAAPREAAMPPSMMEGMGAEPGQESRSLGQQLRQAGSTVDNLVRAAASGMTFGLADKAAGGMDYLTGNAPSYDAGVKAQRARTDALPAAQRVTGEVAGGLAGGVGLAKSGLTLAGRLGPALFRRVLGYGAEGAAYGAAHGAGNTYSDEASHRPRYRRSAPHCGQGCQRRLQGLAIVHWPKSGRDIGGGQCNAPCGCAGR
jgi:hypothetical protein